MLTTIGLNGFKSFYGTGSIGFGPLTVLCGSNSSGKSSLFQPLLLLKQTLESPFDPGPLLLEGPNVRITSAEQVLTKQRSRGEDRFVLVVGFSNSPYFSWVFKKATGGFALSSQGVSGQHRKDATGLVDISEGEEISFRSEKMTELAKSNQLLRAWMEMSRGRKQVGFNGCVAVRDRCLIGLSLEGRGLPKERTRVVDIDLAAPVSTALKEMIHVPGLRGTPERDYKTTAVGKSFPGTFDNYVASVILQWQNTKSPKLARLSEHLAEIGLNSGVGATEHLDTRVAIEVSRFSGGSGDSTDRVSIADVGLGVSQVLPFLVALLAAKPGQIVYVEQPEIHLHPSSQHKLAKPIREALARGVQVIVETHSALLLRGLQTAVAKGEISHESAVFNWFSRHEESGATRVDTVTLSRDGSFGDWPADFDEVSLSADAAFLDVSEEAASLEVLQSVDDDVRDSAT